MGSFLKRVELEVLEAAVHGPPAMVVRVAAVQAQPMTAGEAVSRLAHRLWQLEGQIARGRAELDGEEGPAAVAMAMEKRSDDERS